MVHMPHKHEDISRKSRDEDPFGFTLQVGTDFLHGDDGDEDTGGLRNILGISITPFDVGGMSVLEDADGLHLDCAVELAMGRVILECKDYIVEANEEVVNGNNFHYARCNDSPGNQGSNTAKSVHPILHLKYSARCS